MEKKEFKLKPRQKLFVEEFLVDLNALQAAIRSGYSKKTAGAIGAENLKKPHIRAAIDEALTLRAEKTKVTAEWVLIEAKRVYEHCFEEQTAVAIRALELCGKHVDVQAFKDKTEVVHRFEDKKPDELRGMLAGLLNSFRGK